MKVLIPGISGAIGRLVAKHLAEAGHEIIGIDRRPWRDAPKYVEMHEVDIRKRAAEDVFRKHRPQAVVHMATVTSLVMQGEERHRINLGGTRAVFEHCQAYGVEHVVFVGRHTYYGAGPDSPLYHVEDEAPMALASFPELADLVAADLYASQALWRSPGMTTTVLRLCYSLGPTGHGTLAGYVRGPRVPVVLGFDPLFQFMHEADMATAIGLTLDKRLRGIYNVSGPSPVPLSVVIRETGRSAIPLPEIAFAIANGRFGFPRLPAGAINHIKYPVIVDSSAFTKATGFAHAYDEAATMAAYTKAFPIVHD